MHALQPEVSGCQNSHNGDGQASLRSRHIVEVFNIGRRLEKWADDFTPLGKRRRLAKPHGVSFQRCPSHLQHHAARAFLAGVDRVAQVAL